MEAILKSSLTNGVAQVGDRASGRRAPADAFQRAMQDLAQRDPGDAEDQESMPRELQPQRPERRRSGSEAHHVDVLA